MVLSDEDDLCMYAKMLRPRRSRERKKRSLFLGHGSLSLSPAFLSPDLFVNWATDVEASAHAYIRTWYSRDSD